MTAGPGVVLRAGELFLKGKNRPMFERALEQSVRRLLARHGALELHRGQGRLYVTGGAPEGLVRALSQVFGVSSLSPVLYVERDLESMAVACVELAREAIAGGARTFRVSARRADKRFELTSSDLNRELGARVAAATGLAVDLDNADLDLGVEVGPSLSFVFRTTLAGGGGLPIGTGGGALLLLSGGIDSPVAGHLAQKRGLALEAAHFHSAPWTSAASQEKVRRLCAVLATRQGAIRLHMVAFAEAQEQVRDRAPAAYRVILYRRLMLRMASAIAAQTGASALVTGESLGQVASQTVENIQCIQRATDLLVLRPLIGFDKVEVVDLARRIDTYDISVLPHDDCCSLFVPPHPETRGSVGRAAELEALLDVDALVERAVAQRESEVIEGTT